MKKVGALFVLLLALPAFAQQPGTGIGTPFAFQNNYSTITPLTGSPLLLPSGGVGTPGVNLVVGASLFSSGLATVSITIGGITQSQSFELTACDCFYNLIGSFTLPKNLYHPTDGSVTFSLNGDVLDTEYFRVLVPTPEPGALLFMATGLVGIAGVVKKKVVGSFKT